MLNDFLWAPILNHGVRVIVFVVAVCGLNWLRDYKRKRQDANGRTIKAKDFESTSHEEIIATEVIHVDDIDIDFGQIGGLDHTIQDLRECVIYRLCCPEPTGVLGTPPGVLLYGPSGCGKTMMAKALAKESNATIINLRISTIINKFSGEPDTWATSVLSLARKLQPTIVFIDEIDSFLRDRRGGNHDVTLQIKSELMCLLDGLTSDEDCRIMILGATNRPNDIDAAFLRRMPKRFAIGLPTDAQRKSILELLLRDVKLVDNFDMDKLVQHTTGYSGSDLKEMCRNATMIPDQRKDANQDLAQFDIKETDKYLRPLTITDFYVLDDITGKSSWKVKIEGAPIQVDLD